MNILLYAWGMIILVVGVPILGAKIFTTPRAQRWAREVFVPWVRKHKLERFFK